MTLRRMISAGAVLAMFALGACGNDDSGIDHKSAAKLVGQSIKDSIRPPKQIPAETRIRVQSAEALRLAAPGDPLSAVRFDSVGIASVLRRIETNGRYNIWAAWGTSDRKSIVTKGGLITSTRGLTNDLMSSDADALIKLVRNREEGVVQYSQRYLDGNFQIVEAKHTCTVSRGYDKVVSLAGGRDVAALQMFASCVSANRQFVDLFLVDFSGRIVEMRQWVGPGLGFAYLKQLR